MAADGVRARLGRAFLLQSVFIGAAAVVGVFLASLLLEGVLIRQALSEEAAHFWQQRDRDPAFPLPATVNLTGHLGAAPAPITGLPPGYHDRVVDGVDTVVYVSDRGGERLYLMFDRSGVGKLATMFGLLPLAMVLLVLYLTTWLAFRASRRAFSPVIALARAVRGLDPASPDPAQLDPARLPKGADDEVRELAEALNRYAQRLNEFVARERDFTRDASHELRSPLTVIQLSAGMLETDAGLSEASRRSVARIARAARDMEELTSAFLLLARESQTGLPVEDTCINDVLADELDRARPLAAGRPIASQLTATHRLSVDAPEKVLPVLLGNLLRNAFSYTDAGEVAVEIGAASVVIRDTGVGMAAEKLDAMYKPFVRGETARRGGHGVGLTIVRRLSDRFGWPVTIESSPGVGTRVEIGFPDARSEPLDG
ncbi:MAG: sensor histidine kinase [Gammaproteobacteria bacterium]